MRTAEDESWKRTYAKMRGPVTMHSFYRKFPFVDVGGTLAAAIALTRSTTALRAIASFDALRERGRPFVCERCGRHYSVSYTLDRHRKYECGVDKQFFCRKCYRPFSRADSMRVHMRNCLAKLTPSTSTSPSDDHL
ncbi:hypothetical protein LSTR_LSTR000935 [Laodelphax striatellus]|uniref:C2H2-type domain-containing protein n=1 Tax=Laodelphax striatellus TaxID=195883 RepID=A0A482X0S3_LAOST|nr:hypothetical protein LSTR_LSTR000935 [Laodelphax striatellus]